MCDEATILTRPTRMTKFPVGTELSLRCRCRSSGTGTVRWIKNGATVRPVNGRISLDHRKLVINSTSFADSGNYTCYVTIDKLGTAKSNKLEIWGKYNLNIVSIIINHRPSCLLPLCQKESLWETIQVHFDANQTRFIWKVWHEYSSWFRTLYLSHFRQNPDKHLAHLRQQNTNSTEATYQFYCTLEVLQIHGRKNNTYSLTPLRISRCFSLLQLISCYLEVLYFIHNFGRFLYSNTFLSEIKIVWNF